jgi:hypothetical protein
VNPTQRHWFLDLAAHDSPARLDWIVPHVRPDVCNVLPIPGFGDADYREGLVELIEQELIRLRSSSRAYDTSDAERLISESLVGESLHSFDFSLTERGGAVWEALAQPKWDHFVKTENEYPNGLNVGSAAQGVLASTNRDLLMAYLGWYQPLRHASVQWHTMRWDIHDSYQIRYWKKLSSVHVLNFSCLVDERNLPPEQDWFEKWARTLSYWYVRPWQLEGWKND